MDNRLLAKSVSRCTFAQFMGWLTPWTGGLVFGAYAAWLCLYHGLNQTNMDNRFAFGLWIFLDLAVIALGAGAFFTGFLMYVLRRHEVSSVINSAVVLGFICYSGAVAILAIDVGQPLRAWFTFWHPNTHSMLTEVTFCITAYLIVLTIEYLPVMFRNRRLRSVPGFLVFGHELHRAMPVFALAGTFLSFFHQGSLGGLYGVLRGRPFAFRDGLGIWPTTFFLFILSAIAAGPCFVILITKLAGLVTRKRLVRDDVFVFLARVSGWLLTAYVLAKSVDTLVWINATSPRAGFSAFNYYASEPFGPWILFAEIGLFGLLPALMLLLRANPGGPWITAAALLCCSGVVLNRFVLTIQTLALPTLPFDRVLHYFPSWQESASFFAVVAYGVILYSVSYRYLQLFPHEKELQGR
jgi:molybdopterin-containing oxidoreductase family membrane subunit